MSDKHAATYHGGNYELEYMANWWTNTETGVTIFDEDMPDELRPSLTRRRGPVGK